MGVLTQVAWHSYTEERRMTLVALDLLKGYEANKLVANVIAGRAESHRHKDLPKGTWSRTGSLFKAAAELSRSRFGAKRIDAVFVDGVIRVAVEIHKQRVARENNRPYKARVAPAEPKDRRRWLADSLKTRYKWEFNSYSEPQFIGPLRVWQSDGRIGCLTTKGPAYFAAPTWPFRSLEQLLTRHICAGHTVSYRRDGEERFVVVDGEPLTVPELLVRLGFVRKDPK